MLGYFPPLLLAVSLLAVYLATMAPGLTWANAGADGGDLIAAAATGGVAHPTGYPLYLLLARLFQCLPVGSLAYRTNLLSAVAAVLAALLVYALVDRNLSSLSSATRWLAGLASGAAIGLSPLFWSQAVITEVYALHAFFVALLLFLSIDDSSLRISKNFHGLFLGLAFGLAMGNHVTSLLLFPVVFSTALRRDPVTAQGKRLMDRWQLDVTLPLAAACLVGGWAYGLPYPSIACPLAPSCKLGQPHYSGRAGLAGFGQAVPGSTFYFVVSSRFGAG